MIWLTCHACGRVVEADDSDDDSGVGRAGTHEPPTICAACESVADMLCAADDDVRRATERMMSKHRHSLLLLVGR